MKKRIVILFTGAILIISSVTLLAFKSSLLKKNETNVLTMKNGEEISSMTEQLNIHFDKIKFFREIKDKGNYQITYDSILTQSFVQGEGWDSIGHHVLFRSPIEIQNQRKGEQVILLSTAGDSCTGVNCSYCVFTAGSGCDCERAGGGTIPPSPYCNHSTTTEEVE